MVMKPCFLLVNLGGVASAAGSFPERMFTVITLSII